MTYVLARRNHHANAISSSAAPRTPFGGPPLPRRGSRPREHCRDPADFASQLHDDSSQTHALIMCTDARANAHATPTKLVSFAAASLLVEYLVGPEDEPAIFKTSSVPMRYHNGGKQRRGRAPPPLILGWDLDSQNQATGTIYSYFKKDGVDQVRLATTTSLRISDKEPFLDTTSRGGSRRVMSRSGTRYVLGTPSEEMRNKIRLIESMQARRRSLPVRRQYLDLLARRAAAAVLIAAAARRVIATRRYLEKQAEATAEAKLSAAAAQQHIFTSCQNKRSHQRSSADSASEKRQRTGEPIVLAWCAKRWRSSVNFFLPSARRVR
eukprot:6172637-Pleurochrysis_carterae.AAC.1